MPVAVKYKVLSMDISGYQTQGIAIGQQWLSTKEVPRSILGVLGMTFSDQAYTLTSSRPHRGLCDLQVLSC